MKKEFDWKAEKLFLYLGIFFIGIMVFIMPISRVPDEITHAKNAWNLVYELREDSFQWKRSVSTDIHVDKDEYKKIFTKKIDMKKEKVKVHFTLKHLVYLPQLIGMLIGRMLYPSVGVIITFGRIINAIVFLLGMYFIIKYARYGKEAIVFLSLLPILLQQAASLSYDVANILTIIGFFTLLTNLSIDKILTKKYCILICLSAFLLYITKTNNLILLLLLLTLNLRFPPKYEFLNNRIEKVSRVIYQMRYLIIFIIGILGLSFAYIYFLTRGGVVHFIQIMFNSVFNNQLNGQLNTILTVGMFGFLGNFQYQIPLWLIFIDVAILVLLMAQKNKNDVEKTFGLFSGIMFPTHVLVIIGGMYFAWTPLVLGDNAMISLGAQGRYFTPFLVYLIPMFISYSNSLSVCIDRKFQKKLIMMTLLFNYIVMLGLLILTYWTPGHQTNWILYIKDQLIK